MSYLKTDLKGFTMSSAAIHVPSISHTPSVLRRLAARLRAAGEGRALARDQARVSAFLRRDIGVGRSDVGAKVDAAMVRIELGRIGYRSR